MILIKQQDNTYKPKYKSDLEYTESLKNGREVLCELKTPRNPKHHRLLFAMIRCVLDNSDDAWGRRYGIAASWPQRDAVVKDFLSAILIDLGMVELRQRLNGDVYVVPTSIRPASMSVENFSLLSNEVAKICADRLELTIDVFDKRYKDYL